MNATINDCSLYKAIQRADKKAKELPHICQVVASDFDGIVMAAEIRRLHKSIRDLLENGPEIGDGYASDLRTLVYGNVLPSNQKADPAADDGGSASRALLDGLNFGGEP